LPRKQTQAGEGGQAPRLTVQEQPGRRFAAIVQDFLKLWKAEAGGSIGPVTGQGIPICSTCAFGPGRYVQCWKQTRNNLARDRTEEHALHAVLQGRSA
jgi:hypothetical protein